MSSDCDKCKGAGRVTCKACGGGGTYSGVALGVDALLSPCPNCGATGKIQCPKCGGSGKV